MIAYVILPTNRRNVITTNTDVNKIIKYTETVICSIQIEYDQFLRK